MRPMQIPQYHNVNSLPAVGAQQFVTPVASVQNGASFPAVDRHENAPRVFRLQVMNVPQYLRNDEFCGQFLKVEGCVDANVSKDGARIFYYIDFNSQEMAEKCIANFTQWKGWGPKGLAFQPVGFVIPSFSGLTPVDRGAQNAAKQPHISTPAASKQDGPNLQMSGAQLPLNAGVAPNASLPQPSLPTSQQKASVYPQSGMVMYQRPDGTLFVPANGVGTGDMSSQAPPSMSDFSVQYGNASNPQGANTTVNMPPPQQESLYGQKPAPGAPDSNTAPAAGLQVLGGSNQGVVNSTPSSVPPVQYVRLADGSLKALMAVGGTASGQQPSSMVMDQQTKSVGDVYRVQSAEPVVQDHGYAHTEPQMGPSQPVFVSNVPGVSSNVPVLPAQLGSSAAQANPRDTPSQFIEQNTPALAMGGQRSMDNTMQAPPDSTRDSNADLPGNATQTLYVDDVPLDMQKRELSHIFRPFGGFKEVRIVSKSTKEGRPYSFAFAQFENAECAAAALNCLDGYQYDIDEPQSGVMQLKYARQERNKQAYYSRFDENRGHSRNRPMRPNFHDSADGGQGPRFRRAGPPADPKKPRFQ